MMKTASSDAMEGIVFVSENFLQDKNLKFMIGQRRRFFSFM
jgi:hypothetical protein